jgi:hypothetical protein
LPSANRLRLLLLLVLVLVLVLVVLALVLVLVLVLLLVLLVGLSTSTCTPRPSRLMCSRRLCPSIGPRLTRTWRHRRLNTSTVSALHACSKNSSRRCWRPAGCATRLHSAA